MDVEFALELAAFIENDKKTAKRPHFDMTLYAQGSAATTKKVRAGGEPNYCNTAGCIAGSAVFLRDRKLFVQGLIDSNVYYQIQRSAQRILKLTEKQADALFAPEEDVDLRKVKAEDAVAMLRWLAEDPARRCRVPSIRRKWIELVEHNALFEKIAEKAHNLKVDTLKVTLTKTAPGI